MLTFGHSPREILRALATDVVQANIMTASLEHDHLTTVRPAFLRVVRFCGRRAQLTRDCQHMN